MKFVASIGTILKTVLVVGGMYALVMWAIDKPQNDDVVEFARRACADEIRGRFDVSNVTTYSVKENNNGYVVRASATLARGGTAKVVCLTNVHGAVKDLSLDER